MRSITQKEFDKLCDDDTLSMLEDCIIGENIEYPEKVHHIVFKNCTFEKPIIGVELYQVTFQMMYLPDAFRNCTFDRVRFEHCNASGNMFENCKFNTVTFCLCYAHYTVFDGSMNYVEFKLCDLYSSRFSVHGSSVQFYQCDMCDCSALNNCISFPQGVPSEGSFIAWKKARMWELDGDHYNRTDIIVKLRIPENAKRCSANHKCRANMVEVIQYETLDGDKLPDNIEVHSLYNGEFTYHIGMIESDMYISNPQRECGNGIHFFLNRDDAVSYVL